MSDKEKEFLNSFKAGEYANLTILIELKDLSKFVEYLKASGLKMAIMPHVKTELDFQTDTSGATNN